MTPNHTSNFTIRNPVTSAISRSVGSTLKTMNESSVEMPRVPRSISRVSPPVWRSRWKRSDNACKWWKTSSAMRRMARCATFTNTMSRSSLKTVLERRSSP